jgi:hypothetical protein
MNVALSPHGMDVSHQTLYTFWRKSMHSLQLKSPGLQTLQHCQLQEIIMMHRKYPATASSTSD